MEVFCVYVEKTRRSGHTIKLYLPMLKKKAIPIIVYKYLYYLNLIIKYHNILVYRMKVLTNSTFSKRNICNFEM